MGNLLRINESIYKSGWWFEIFHVSFHRTWGWWPISGALKSQSKHGFVRLLSSRISSWDDIAQNSKREEAKVVGVFVTKHIQWIADKKSALSRFDPVVDSRLVSRCLPPIPLKKQDFNRLPVYHLFAMVSYPCCMYLHPSWFVYAYVQVPKSHGLSDPWPTYRYESTPSIPNLHFTSQLVDVGYFCWFVPAERSKLTHAQPWWASLGIPWCTPWRRWTPVYLTMFDP